MVAVESGEQESTEGIKLNGNQVITQAAGR